MSEPNTVLRSPVLSPLIVIAYQVGTIIPIFTFKILNLKLWLR